MNHWYTHREYLQQALESFDYSKDIKCLEFGTGHGSSEIFHQYAKKYQNINIQAYEHDYEWFNKMRDVYGLPNYNFNVVTWNDFKYDELKQQKYDLIFVDQGDWDARIATIDQLKNTADIIILHDYCYYNGHRGNEIKEDQRERALTIAEGSFFYNKYNSDFILESCGDLSPPTLILRRRK